MSQRTHPHNGAAPAGLVARMTEVAHERGARLSLAGRDAHAIAGMLDNHDRPKAAELLRRSGSHGERLGRSLSQAEETDLRRAAAITGAAATVLLMVRKLRS